MKSTHTSVLSGLIKGTHFVIPQFHGLLFALLFVPFYSQSQHRQLDTLPSEMERFIGPLESPDFGMINPNAPEETMQFGQFVGLWAITTHAFSGGQWYTGWPALWGFKYVLDGYAVQDLWFTGKDDLSPPMAHLKRDFLGTNLRIYDPKSEEWKITWCTNQGDDMNSSPFSRHTALMEEGVIEMRPVGQTGDTLRRVLFRNITDTTFSWMNEQTKDGGMSWSPTLRLEAKRIR